MIGSWPDMSLPRSPDAILNFIKAIENKQTDLVMSLGDSWNGNPWGPPITMHCKAGFGRTGSTNIFEKKIENSIIFLSKVRCFWSIMQSTCFKTLRQSTFLQSSKNFERNAITRSKEKNSTNFVTILSSSLLTDKENLGAISVFKILA